MPRSMALAGDSRSPPREVPSASIRANQYYSVVDLVCVGDVEQVDGVAERRIGFGAFTAKLPALEQPGFAIRPRPYKQGHGRILTPSAARSDTLPRRIVGRRPSGATN
jgi:hypothetical protein